MDENDEGHIADLSLVELDARLFPEGRSSLKDYGRLRATIQELSDEYGHDRIMAMIKELNSFKRVTVKVAAEDVRDAFVRFFENVKDRRNKSD
jgi:hypothetical protein